MATQRRGWDAALLRTVDAWALDGWTPAQITRELDKWLQAGKLVADKVPDPKTIQRWVKELQPRDMSGPWRLALEDAEDVDFLLAARAAVMAWTDGRVRELTNDVAKWLRVIHAAVPDLTAVWAYKVARLYQSRTERGQDTGDLDLWLGMGPWRNVKAAAVYERAVRSGWVAVVPNGLDWRDRVLYAALIPAAPGELPHLGSDLSWVDVVARDPDQPEQLSPIP